MNQLSYYVTKRLIVGSKDSSGTIIHIAEQRQSTQHSWNFNGINKEVDGIGMEWLVEWLICEAKWRPKPTQWRDWKSWNGVWLR